MLFLLNRKGDGPFPVINSNGYRRFLLEGLAKYPSLGPTAHEPPSCLVDFDVTPPPFFRPCRDTIKTSHNQRKSKFAHDTSPHLKRVCEWERAT